VPTILAARLRPLGFKQLRAEPLPETPETQGLRDLMQVMGVKIERGGAIASRPHESMPAGHTLLFEKPLAKGDAERALLDAVAPHVFDFAARQGAKDLEHGLQLKGLKWLLTVSWTRHEVLPRRRQQS